jgi:DNA-binding NarL/FixJ family response regulator
MNVQKLLIASPPWTVDEDEQLRSLIDQGQTALEIGAQLQRTENAIQHRMTKLGLRSKRVKSARLASSD